MILYGCLVKIDEFKCERRLQNRYFPDLDPTLYKNFKYSNKYYLHNATATFLRRFVIRRVSATNRGLRLGF